MIMHVDVDDNIGDYGGDEEFRFFVRYLVFQTSVCITQSGLGS